MKIMRFKWEKTLCTGRMRFNGICLIHLKLYTSDFLELQFSLPNQHNKSKISREPFIIIHHAVNHMHIEMEILTRTGIIYTYTDSKPI